MLKQIICKKGLCAYRDEEYPKNGVYHLAEYEFLGVFQNPDGDEIYIHPMCYYDSNMPLEVIENVAFLDAPLDIYFLVKCVRGAVLDGAKLKSAMDQVERAVRSIKPEFEFNGDIVYTLYVKHYGLENL